MSIRCVKFFGGQEGGEDGGFPHNLELLGVRSNLH